MDRGRERGAGGGGGCREYRSGQAVATHLTPDVGYAGNFELENFNTQAGREGRETEREMGGGGGREREKG